MMKSHRRWLGALIAGASLFFIWKCSGADELLFPNSDFERGDLTHWIADGRAFRNQPTFGDNSWYRDGGSAHPIGNYWIGTFENRHTPREVAGKVQGDSPTGTLTSVSFEIRKGKIIFFLGGGNNAESEGAALWVEGRQVLFEPGRGCVIKGERMRKVIWDVSAYKGKQATIVMTDFASGEWGHINADDFRYA